jgi:hypothetical protein
MVSRMRHLLSCAIVIAVVSPACGSTPTTPTTATAALALRAPGQAIARACAPCNNGDLEIAADLVVEETAGVGGSITAIDVLLRNGSTVLAGPGQYSASSVSQLAGGTNRVGARGSLTVREVGVHFPASFRVQLPATYTMNVTFRDDNGHIINAMATLQAMP